MFLISIYQWKGPKNVGDVKIQTPKTCIFTISLSLFVNAFRSSLFSVFLINLTVPQFFVLTRSTNIVTETMTHKT
jgi:hypothetical protein